MTALVLALAGCAPSVGQSDVAVSGGVVAEAVRVSVAAGGPADLIATDRPTLVAFMTRWCEACRREQPALESWARSHADVRTAVVVSGSPRADVDALVAERRLDVGVLSIVSDPSGGLADGLGVRATPALLLFAPGGTTPTGRYTRVDELPPVGGRGAGARAAGAVEVVTDTGTELGTSYDAQVLGPEEQARRDLADARALVRELGAQLSEWSPDSEVSRVNREAWAGPVVLSPTLRRLIAGAIHVSRQTGGAFDITWASLGEPGEGGGRTEAALAGVGSEHLILDGDTLRFGHAATRIGLGGVAKGDIIDAAFLLLRSRGYASVVVNIGGDLRTAGRDEAGERRRFEIVDPYHPQEVAGSIEVDDTAIATSGNYLRRRQIGGQVVGHIVDPRTGHPPSFDGSVTVLTRDAAMADALATALFVMGPDEGLAFVKGREGVKAIFVTRDGVRATVPVESR